MSFIYTILLLASLGIFYVLMRQAPEPKKARISDLEILNRQYESGQISVSEYLIRLQQLR
jgi:hypothetical protein